MRYALLNSTDDVIEYREFQNDPPVVATQKKLRWVAAPEPPVDMRADVVAPPAPQITLEEIDALVAAEQVLLAAKAEAKADAVVQYLRDHTVAECMQYVEDNATDFASLKAIVKRMVAVHCVTSKELLR